MPSSLMPEDRHWPMQGLTQKWDAYKTWAKLQPEKKASPEWEMWWYLQFPSPRSLRCSKIKQIFWKAAFAKLLSFYYYCIGKGSDMHGLSSHWNPIYLAWFKVVEVNYIELGNTWSAFLDRLMNRPSEHPKRMFMPVEPISMCKLRAFRIDPSVSNLTAKECFNSFPASFGTSLQQHLSAETMW